MWIVQAFVHRNDKGGPGATSSIDGLQSSLPVRGRTHGRSASAPPGLLGHNDGGMSGGGLGGRRRFLRAAHFAQLDERAAMRSVFARGSRLSRDSRAGAAAASLESDERARLEEFFAEAATLGMTVCRIRMIWCRNH